MTSERLGNRLLTSRGNLLSLKMRRCVSQTWRGRSICFKRSILSSNRRPSICMMSLRSPSMFIDGESLNALSLKHMKWSKRFSLCKRDLSQRPKKFQRKMYLFRRKKSSILSLKTLLPSRVVLKSLKNCRSISKTWKREQTNLKKWLRNSKTTRVRLTPTDLRLKDLISRSAQSRSSTSTASRTLFTKKWRVITSKWIWIKALITTSTSSNNPWWCKVVRLNSSKWWWNSNKWCSRCRQEMGQCDQYVLIYYKNVYKFKLAFADQRFKLSN